ncbi:MAG: hypothetical protein ABEI86_15240, partial [Halobacteriaceae archaeon]
LGSKFAWSDSVDKGKCADSRSQGGLNMVFHWIVAFTMAAVDIVNCMEHQSSFLGYARIGLLLGFIIASGGIFFHLEYVAWIGGGIIILSLVLNTGVKIHHYRKLEMTPTQRTRIIGTWIMLIIVLSGLILVGIGITFGYAYDRYFWPLVFVTLVLIVLHRIFRGAYFPHSNTN